MSRRVGRFPSAPARAEFFEHYDRFEAQWPQRPESTDVATAFGSTRVYLHGRGDAAPLVLLPPMGGNGLCWYPLIGHLPTDRTVIAPDTIGTPGRTEQTAPVTGPAEFAAWLDEVLAALGVAKAHLMGYSDGAWHAALAVNGSARRLASVTFVDGSTPFTKLPWRMVLMFLRAGLRPTERNLRRLAEFAMPHRPPTELEVDLSRAAVGYRRTLPWPRVLTDKDLAAFDVPVLAVLGARSPVGKPLEARDRILAHVPDSRVEIIEDRTHDLLFHEPDVVMPLVLDFIRSHDPVV
ncbi:alpha/beta hydrolase [Phytomonospora sp. NPDC050363]|uniref:alpha/beta fold hydrolase n=1 Tax=Phytomonospora sp. NPDC050363 TaxID=3155642 RepID=UPI0033C0CC89